MSGDVHVRFREGLGVRFPRATRLVIVFRNESDARRVMEVVPKRFGKYGLTLHPEKTRLIAFERPRNLHRLLGEQQRVLSQKLRGHCAYYGITGNSLSLSAFRRRVHRTWRYWLSRRNRERSMTWDRFNQLLETYPLPPATAIHSVCRSVAKP